MCVVVKFPDPLSESIYNAYSSLHHYFKGLSRARLRGRNTNLLVFQCFKTNYHHEIRFYIILATEEAEPKQSGLESQKSTKNILLHSWSQ